MCTLLKSTLLAILVCLAFINVTQAQTYGQIFTRQEADERFGPVLISVSISKQAVYSFLTRTNNYIMFNVKDNKAIVLDNQRRTIHPKTALINTSDVFHMFSVSVVNQLLSLGNDDNVYIEKRNEVLSVSSGGYTMEVGVWCPPICD